IDFDLHFAARHLDRADPVARRARRALRTLGGHGRKTQRGNERRPESTMHGRLLRDAHQKSRRATLSAAPYNIAADAAAVTNSPSHGGWPARKYASALITPEIP